MEKSVYYGGKMVGSAVIYTENGKSICDFACPFENNKVYKLFLQSAENREALGIMLKNNQRFTIKKPFNSKKYGINGEKIDYIYIEKHTLGSKNTPPLEFSIDEFSIISAPLPTLDHALQNCLEEGGIFSHFYDGYTYLCAPMIKNMPFALAPFFCLTTPVICEKGVFGVIKLNNENLPIFMNNTLENDT